MSLLLFFALQIFHFTAPVPPTDVKTVSNASAVHVWWEGLPCHTGYLVELTAGGAPSRNLTAESAEVVLTRLKGCTLHTLRMWSAAGSRLSAGHADFSFTSGHADDIAVAASSSEAAITLEAK